MSSSTITFAEFYSDIRAYYASNLWEYEKFKHNRDNRSKVEFLLKQDVVKTALERLMSSNTQIPLCSIFGVPQKTKEEKSSRQFPPNLVNGSTKYPQMSKKIEVKVSKKKGRMLVAKDKIEPGITTEQALNKTLKSCSRE